MLIELVLYSSSNMSLQQLRHFLDCIQDSLHDLLAL
jgi:hypothetical protein